MDEGVGSEQFSEGGIEIERDVPREDDLSELGSGESAQLGHFKKSEERSERKRPQHELEPLEGREGGQFDEAPFPSFQIAKAGEFTDCLLFCFEELGEL